MAIDQLCPWFWFPEDGSFELQEWDKIGAIFHNHPHITKKILYTWCKVRSCMAKLSPQNMVQDQQIMLSAKTLPSSPPLVAEGIVNKLPDPLPEPSPALSTANDGKLLSAAFVDAVPAAALDMEPVHPGSPVLRATAPAQAEKYAQIPSEALKELHHSIHDNGLQAPYTHSLLEGLALQKLLPTDWQMIIRDCLTPTEAMLCLQEWRELATATAAENEAHRPPVPFTLPMLMGEDTYATTALQMLLPDTALSSVAEIALKAWSRIPAESDSNVMWELLPGSPDPRGLESWESSHGSPDPQGFENWEPTKGLASKSNVGWKQRKRIKNPTRDSGAK
ncbi:hypothetical protein JRQ81_002903 [Phrynocephalus forsythii]|uniref:Beta-retroviral matrix protein domain-containing protein n=1 Tax=Phrynocephalus forsythii TaxID=171643 RepID=A0A9Q1AWN1_9SAUR|nr:hypothetical protein JRQ81_002903 [Phrynocephalus forsythii]